MGRDASRPSSIPQGRDREAAPRRFSRAVWQCTDRSLPVGLGSRCSRARPARDRPATGRSPRIASMCAFGVDAGAASGVVPATGWSRTVRPFAAPQLSDSPLRRIREVAGRWPPGENWTFARAAGAIPPPPVSFLRVGIITVAEGAINELHVGLKGTMSY